MTFILKIANYDSVVAEGIVFHKKVFFLTHFLWLYHFNEIKFEFFLPSDKLLPQLLQCLELKSEKIQTIAASALWALVFNNQKVYTYNVSFITDLSERANKTLLADFIILSQSNDLISSGLIVMSLVW